MQIETWPIDRPKPYERNPRINDEAVEAVAKSIREFGFRQPLVVDGDGVLIVGHTRLKAAQRIGLSEVPVHVARDLTAAQVQALRIADNQTATIAEWNYDLLPLELTALKKMDFDLDLLGFDSQELMDLLHPDGMEGQCDANEVPEPPDEATTQHGDLWLLGDHRLLCGDSSKSEDVDRLLDRQSIHLVNSDPPYNVAVSPRSGNAVAAGLSTFNGPEKPKAGQRKLRAKDRPLKNDFVSEDEFTRLLDAWFSNFARVLLPGRCFYLWGGFSNCANYPAAMKTNGLYFSQAIIWHKLHPVLTRKDFMGDHEWCFYGWREGAGHSFFGPNNIPDVWQVKKIPPQKMEHLTAKPAELAVRAITYSSKPGENVLDLFGGSGSTLIGAEQTGRKAFLMELDPLYCDVIVDRYQRFTGKPAVLERTGESPIPMRPREEAMR